MRIPLIARVSTAAVLAALFLTGCALPLDDDASCRLAENDSSRLVCDGREYTILEETLPDDNLGTRRGSLRTVVAFGKDGFEVARMDVLAGLADLAALAERAPDAVGTMSFAGVFECLGSEGELIVQVDGRNHRAVPDDEPAGGAAVLAFSPATEDGTGDDGFAIDPTNAKRIVNGRAFYEIKDDPVDEARIGVLLDAVPKGATFDVETLRPLTRDELLALDWDGTQNQRRETIVYDGIWSLAGDPVKEAVAVESDGIFLLAVRIQPDAL